LTTALESIRRISTGILNLENPEKVLPASVFTAARCLLKIVVEDLLFSAEGRKNGLPLWSPLIKQDKSWMKIYEL
jgi:hypothetical protein